jgi:DNA-binding NarL/FixJ family response regulator
MSTDAALRVLVVDDHDLFRTGLRALLEEAGGMEVADAPDGEAALSMLQRFMPDVVVMDINMPGMSGIEATRRVRDAQPGASVLMLTINRDETRVVDAVRAGASGYVLKGAELDQIVAAIRAAASGQPVLDPAAAGAVMAHVRDSPSETPSTAVADLSKREREVLVLIARGCDNAAIGERLFMSASTVKHHVSSILQKLGVENRLQAAAIAIRDGVADGGGEAR